MNLVKTIVFLTGRQRECLDRYRDQLGVSLSEAMRRLLDDCVVPHIPAQLKPEPEREHEQEGTI